MIIQPLAALARICDRALGLQSREEADQLSKDILLEIEAFNVVGLGDPQRRNWYSVDPQDLFNSAAKVEASKEEISQMLRLSGFLI